jgi:hypothetical protein
MSGRNLMLNSVAPHPPALPASSTALRAPPTSYTTTHRKRT